MENPVSGVTGAGAEDIIGIIWLLTSRGDTTGGEGRAALVAFSPSEPLGWTPLEPSTDCVGVSAGTGTAPCNDDDDGPDDVPLG